MLFILALITLITLLKQQIDDVIHLGANNPNDPLKQQIDDVIHLGANNPNNPFTEKVLLRLVLPCGDLFRMDVEAGGKDFWEKLSNPPLGGLPPAQSEISPSCIFSLDNSFHGRECPHRLPTGALLQDG